MEVSPRRLNIPSGPDWFYSQHSYLITFSKIRVSIWRIGHSDEGFHPIAHLHPSLDAQEWRSYPTIDVEHDILIIADHEPQHDSARLLVFNLATGQRIREIRLYGTLPWISRGKIPLRHCDGQVLVVVEEDEEYMPPYGRITAILYYVVGNAGIVGGLRLPPCLASRDKERIAAPCVLFPIAVMPNGDVTATSTVLYGETMDVLRYKGSDILNIAAPDASFELWIPVGSGYNELDPLCTAPLDEHGFLVAVYEADRSLHPVQKGCQTSIYAVDTEPMKIRWHAEPVGGEVHSIRKITVLDAVVVIGQHDDGDSEGNDPYAYVLILDPITGARRQLETVRHPVLNTAHDAFRGRSAESAEVKYCGLCNTGDRLTVIIVFRDGLVYAIDLRRLLEDDLPQGRESVVVTEPLAERWWVLEASVVEGIVVTLVDVETTGTSQYIRYVSLH